MARKGNPVIGILRYFEHADLPLAQQALELAKEIVKRRTPVATKGKTRKASKPAPAAAPTPAEVQAIAEGGESKPRRRRQRTDPTGVTAAAQDDVALPGLGPATIGE